MRIITWNIYWANKKIRQLLEYALSHQPDIICLQEVPSHILPYLQSHSDYHLYSTVNFQNPNRDKNSYICTLTRLPHAKAKEITYHDTYEPSLLNRIFYQTVHRHRELPNAILLHVFRNQKKYCIVNARLPCAVGIHTRLELFRMLLKKTHNTSPIVCGDLNIIDGRIFNWISGWIRGFKRHDYRIHERKAFEMVVAKHKLVNIFYGMNTTIYRPARIQLDHILVPQHIRVLHKELSKRTFGSDHKMLLVDIDT